MTDRDEFAAAALTGLISLNCPSPNQQAPSDLCEFAFRWADAMLRERERTNHDAVPEAKAYADGEPAPTSGGEAGLSPRDGTGNTQDPVAWMVARNGEPCHLSWTLGDARRELNRLELVSTGTPALELFSLYRSPTLTDSDREAIELFATLEWTSLRWSKVEKNAATLRNLLARLA